MVSIIIPLYNKAHTIVGTLKTVFAQTYQDFEVIIVDDGSTDNSIDVINAEFNDSRIRIVRQENGGVSAARNTGIKESNGEWIAFLDADDEWLPEYLDTAILAAEANPAVDFILSGRYSQNISTRVRHSNVPAKYANKILEINLFDNPHVFVHISATIIRAKLLKENIGSFGLFVEGQKSNEDFTFLWRVALHSRCLYIGEPLAIYNGGVDGQATSVLQEQKKLADNIMMRNFVIDEWYTTGCGNKMCRTFMKYELRHSILGRLRRGDYTGIRALIDGMTPQCRNSLLGKVERCLFYNQRLDKVAVLYIYATKILWRLHGYPVVGK